jgi:hypothetical protein
MYSTLLVSSYVGCPLHAALITLEFVMDKINPLKQEASERQQAGYGETKPTHNREVTMIAPRCVLSPCWAYSRYPGAPWGAIGTARGGYHKL